MPSYDRDYMRPRRPSFGAGGIGKPRIPTTGVGWVVAICVVVFILQHLISDPPRGLNGQIIDYGRFVDYGAVSLAKLRQGMVWTLVTHIFLHGGWFHIIGNMLLVWFAGRQLETLLGTKRFLIIFLSGGLVGAVAQMLIHGLPLGDNTPLLGASGGAFALLVAYALINPEQELFILLYFVIPVRLRAKNLARGAFIISLVLAVLFLYLDHSARASGSNERWPLQNVAHMAHLGGMVAGWVFMRMNGYGGSPMTLDRLRRQREQRESGRRGRAGKLLGFGGGGEEDAPARPTDFISGEVDPILDKINREGMHSLTAEERAILERAQGEIERRSSSR